LTNDLALEDFQRGKERGRAVAFVVVSHSAATAFLSGRPGCVRSKA